MIGDTDAVGGAGVMVAMVAMVAMGVAAMT